VNHSASWRAKPAGIGEMGGYGIQTSKKKHFQKATFPLLDVATSMHPFVAN